MLVRVVVARWRRGLENSARAEVWPFLLGYLPWGSTAAERARIRERKREEYLQYKSQWQVRAAGNSSARACILGRWSTGLGLLGWWNRYPGRGVPASAGAIQLAALTRRAVSD